MWALVMLISIGNVDHKYVIDSNMSLNDCWGQALKVKAHKTAFDGVTVWQSFSCERIKK